MTTKLNVALIQSSLAWEAPQENRDAFSRKLEGLPPEVDLVVLPEMFSTGFTMTPQHVESNEGKNTLEWMIKMAGQKGCALVGSLSFAENGTYSNRLFFVEPNGEYHFYDKRHTFTLAGEDKVYRAGKQRLIVNYRGFKICPLICYDLRFPVWARNTELYDVVLYVANWPEPRISAWDTLLKARAIENMAYCIGVNRIGSDALGHRYPGHSAVYDMLGEQLGYATKETIIYATLDKTKLIETRKKLNFLADRDQFNLKV
ncbi:amidohydrolase [Spongiimicrobium sp. 3-5]|uniref:amidohydrolase n=1 Tax=Spongiimicrobium sp. 3-5 TaxID=3332596 RepID=UPI00397F3E1F